MLPRIVSSFDAPIRFAMAYGSGAFKQAGREGGPKPMLDLLFGVTHPSHFHSINLRQNPHHYPLHARLLGSNLAAYVQTGFWPDAGEASALTAEEEAKADYKPKLGLNSGRTWAGAGVWYNPYVEIEGVELKYGVISIDSLCRDLVDWETLYISGRMHKPVEIVRPDPRVRLASHVNLLSALRFALLILPRRFTERELYMSVASISYSGDFRMNIPGGEDPGKVANIVDGQMEEFSRIYRRLMNILGGVKWSNEWRDGERLLEQDTSTRRVASLCLKLPLHIRHLLTVQMRNLLSKSAPNNTLTIDPLQFWSTAAAHPEFKRVLREEAAAIVKAPAWGQSLKGVYTAGVAKSLRYAGAKVSKWRAGRSRQQSLEEKGDR